MGIDMEKIDASNQNRLTKLEHLGVEHAAKLASMAD